MLGFATNHQIQVNTLGSIFLWLILEDHAAKHNLLTIQVLSATLHV